MTTASYNLSQLGSQYNQGGTGAVARTTASKLQESVSVLDFGADPTGSTDSATAINNALTAVGNAGGGFVLLPAGTYLVGSTLNIPDYTALKGVDQKATIIKLKASANVNIIQKASAATGLGAGLYDLTINGNDANNTNGGIYWAGASSGRGPTLEIERVTISYCRPIASAPSSEYAAILITGSVWGVMRDVDISNNQYAVGLWHKASDWLFEGLYVGPNGASYPTHSVILQGGSGNRFTDAYFGGNGGYDQVYLWGAQRNLFANCINDNAWQNGYSFNDNGGTSSSYNVFVGGQISSSGWSANNTYANLLFAGTASYNVFSGVKFQGLQTNKAKYGIQETGTAGNNTICGGLTDGNYGTSFDGRRASSGSYITDVFGFDSTDVGTLTAHTKVNVLGAYASTSPSTSSTPLLRVNNGGAISLWCAGNGYNYMWMQAIQDDGSNTLKNLYLQPLGGLAITPGVAGNTFGWGNSAGTGSVATTFTGNAPTGATAGNPLGWVRINVAGTDRYMPYW